MWITYKANKTVHNSWKESKLEEIQAFFPCIVIGVKTQLLNHDITAQLNESVLFDSGTSKCD